jgi:CRP/FNR family transcriptional regulator
MSFTKNQIILELGSTTKETYVILSGVVKVYELTTEGKEINFAILGRGEIFGEMSLFSSAPRSATVEAIEETETLVLKKSDFQKLIAADPNIALNLLEILAERLRLLHQNILNLNSKKLAERTEEILITLISHYATREISISQEELADIVGATRARLNEALKILERSHKITMSHKSIKLL